MINEPIAIISDIHGNYRALQNVLEDIQHRSIKNIVNLGDSLYGPLDHEGTYELLIHNNIISISGNQGRSIIENMASNNVNPTMYHIQQQMNNDMLNWLNTIKEMTGPVG